MCMNVGATPVMVDVKDDFTINEKDLIKKINYKTKAIIPVDIAGLPCHYDLINKIVSKQKIKQLFIPNGENKKTRQNISYWRLCSLLGATYNQNLLDKRLSIFSFHSVKTSLRERRCNLFKLTKRI